MSYDKNNIIDSAAFAFYCYPPSLLMIQCMMYIVFLYDVAFSSEIRPSIKVN